MQWKIDDISSSSKNELPTFTSRNSLHSNYAAPTPEYCTIRRSSTFDLDSMEHSSLVPHETSLRQSTRAARYRVLRNGYVPLSALNLVRKLIVTLKVI